MGKKEETKKRIETDYGKMRKKSYNLTYIEMIMRGITTVMMGFLVFIFTNDIVVGVNTSEKIIEGIETTNKVSFIIFVLGMVQIGIGIYFMKREVRE